jgi:hypothetical protein
VRPFCAPLCARALFSRRLCERAVSPSLFCPLCAPTIFSRLCERPFCAPLSRPIFSRFSWSLFSRPLFSQRLCEPALSSRPVFSRRQLSTVSLTLFWRRRSLFSSAAA